MNKNTLILAVQLLLTASMMLTLSRSAFAEADSKLWPVIKEAYFAKREIITADFIKINAPARAENGAQVPVSYKIDNLSANGVHIKKLYTFVDGNPIPLTAIYHLSDSLSDLNVQPHLEIFTRIRFEMDAYIHLVAESEDNRLYIVSREVRASGGCGSSDNGDETAIRAAVGKIKLKVGEMDESLKLGSPAYVSFNIKHIMRTGLQRDSATQGYYPAFYIKTTKFTYNNKPLLSVDLGVGTAEDPYFKFNFVPENIGTLMVTAMDNEGKTFMSEIEVAVE